MPMIAVLLAATISSPVAPSNQLEWVRLTVLYDNTVAVKGVESDWGFACLVETANGKLLFDTGAKPEVLKENIKALKVDLSDVDIVVLSHNHWDHTGGLSAVLVPLRPTVIYAGRSYATELEINRVEFRVEPVSDPVEILPGVWTTGEVDGPIKEQALVFDLADGPVVLTGCAHPGIERLTQRAKKICDRPPATVLGGFHLLQTSPEEVKRVIAELRELGVKRAGATHCTGEEAIEAFRQAFGEDFVPLGVGAKAVFPAKKPVS